MMGAYGREFMHTPALDSLSAEGLRFKRAYVQQGWCAPSRRSFLTGLRADTTRVYDLVTLFRETLVDLAGLSVPDGPQGVSLRELFEDPDASVKSAAYSQFVRNADRTYTTYEEAVAMGQAVRTDRYRFIRWIERPETGGDTTRELFDHRKDPNQTVNRPGRDGYADVVSRLEQLADDRFKTPYP